MVLPLLFYHREAMKWCMEIHKGSNSTKRQTFCGPHD